MSLSSISMSIPSFVLSGFFFFVVPDATLGLGAALVAAALGALGAALALETVADGF